jgi:hypothetical protein
MGAPYIYDISRLRVNLVAAKYGGNATIMSCGNAVGSAILAMILFKGQEMKGDWLDAFSSGSIAQMTSRGSMITEAFVNWLTHFSCYKVAGSW